MNRLPGDTKGFAGSAIDRSRPIRFRLDGRLISGFSGDTVLSAALASGIDTLGEDQGSPVALLPGAAPAIAYASHAADLQRYMPMARVPAFDGADFVIVHHGRSNPMSRLFQPGHSLGLRLEASQALSQPWRTVPGYKMSKQDLVIVGGGVAGLSAALAAARSGLSITLLDSGWHLGGHSGLFGTQEGEDTPEEAMSRLSHDVHTLDAVTLLQGAEVFAIRPGLVRAHVIDRHDGVAHGRVVDIEADHIILAPGSLERMPLFSGNRLPGVVGALDAYELARLYGIWPGRSATLATGSNPAYRVSLAASDAGIAVTRLLDPRPHPNSRFIAFTRAHGMRHSTAKVVISAGRLRTPNTLAVNIDPDGNEVVTTERLVACGGWQPDLTLWHLAGGRSAWNSENHRLEAVGDVDNVVLAGSAAGWFTRRAAIQSGADAVDRLLGRPRKPVDDPVIDAVYETRDAPNFVAPIGEAGAPTYLDVGPCLLRRPAPPRRRWAGLLGPSRASGVTALSEAAQPLPLPAVMAGVDLGLIPSEAAGIVAQERVALVPLASTDASDSAQPADPDAAIPQIPDFLRGRFGPHATTAILRPADQRRLEPGMLVYTSSDHSDPTRAVGVVLRETPDGALALVEETLLAAGLPVSLRAGTRSISARLSPP
jgi:sarcosine oxidase subunit alpha